MLRHRKLTVIFAILTFIFAVASFYFCGVIYSNNSVEWSWPFSFEDFEAIYLTVYRMAPVVAGILFAFFTLIGTRKGLNKFSVGMVMLLIAIRNLMYAFLSPIMRGSRDWFGQEYWKITSDFWTEPVIRYLSIAVALFAFLSVCPVFIKRSALILTTDIFIFLLVILEQLTCWVSIDKTAIYSVYNEYGYTMFIVGDVVFSVFLVVLALAALFVSMYRTRNYEAPAENVMPVENFIPVNPIPVNPIPVNPVPANVCPNCGRPLRPDSVFCAGCGNKVG